MADLQCGTKCAAQCECKAGDFEADSCEKFKVCKNGSWETTICDPGMVNLGEKGNLFCIKTPQKESSGCLAAKFVHNILYILNIESIIE